MLRAGHRNLIARARIGRWLHHGGGRRRLAGPLAAALLALLSLSVGASPASAECIAAPEPSGAIQFLCNANDDITFDVTLGVLRHNRFAAGDPGFDSAIDFNTTVANAQSVPNAAGSLIKVFAGTGNSQVTVGNAGTPASTILASFELSLNVGSDSLTIDDSASSTARTITVTATAVNGLGGGVTYDGAEALTIKAGGGGDTITVAGTGTGSTTTVEGGGNDDTINVGAGTLDNLLGPLTVDGGAGSLDQLTVNDRAETTPNTYTLTATTLQHAGAATMGWLQTAAAG